MYLGIKYCWKCSVCVCFSGDVTRTELQKNILFVQYLKRQWRSLIINFRSNPSVMYGRRVACSCPIKAFLYHFIWYILKDPQHEILMTSVPKRAIPHGDSENSRPQWEGKTTGLQRNLRTVKFSSRKKQRSRDEKREKGKERETEKQTRGGRAIINGFGYT